MVVVDNCSFVGDYVSGQDVTRLASMCKLKAGRLAREVTDSCLQFWGGMGFTNEVLVSRFYRYAQIIIPVLYIYVLMVQQVLKEQIKFRIWDWEFTDTLFTQLINHFGIIRQIIAQLQYHKTKETIDQNQKYCFHCWYFVGFIGQKEATAYKLYVAFLQLSDVLISFLSDSFHRTKITCDLICLNSTFKPRVE